LCAPQKGEGGGEEIERRKKGAFCRPRDQLPKSPTSKNHKKEGKKRKKGERAIPDDCIKEKKTGRELKKRSPNAVVFKQLADINR